MNIRIHNGENIRIHKRDFNEYPGEEIGLWLIAEGLREHPITLLAEGVDGDLLLGLCDNDTKSYFGLTSRHAKKLMKNIEFWRAIGDLDNKNGNQLRKVMMEVFELEEELQVLKHVAKIKDREIA